MIKVAQFVVNRVLDGQSVIVQNALGLDQTACVVSIAQILMDPFYRTFNGIQVQ